MSNTDKICLKGLRFEACHGVYEEEKQHKQPFTVNIEMTVDIRAAAANDNLEQSVDYSLVYERVRQVVEGPHINLLETLAERIAAAVLLDKLVEKVRIEVIKLDAAYKGQHFTSAAIIERGRL